MTKQLEFDFEQYSEPRRLYAQPMTEYFRKAFSAEDLPGAIVSSWTKEQVEQYESGFTQPLSSKAFGLRDAEDACPPGCIGCAEPAPAEPILSTDSAERKNTPIFSGVLQYFPLAIAAVARHSKRGNDRHNPGEPLHWAREKSTDHEDCISRHLVDVDHYNAELGEYEEACALAWRALAKLQLLEEMRLGRSK